jgi:hypothetical protein
MICRTEDGDFKAVKIAQFEQKKLESDALMK